MIHIRSHQGFGENLSRVEYLYLVKLANIYITLIWNIFLQADSIYWAVQTIILYSTVDFYLITLYFCLSIITWVFTLHVAFWRILKRQLSASICPSTDKEAQRQEREEDNSGYCLWNIPKHFFANSCSNEWAVINYSHPFCVCFPQIFQHIGLLAWMINAVMTLHL